MPQIDDFERREFKMLGRPVNLVVFISKTLAIKRKQKEGIQVSE
jgi:hypothetical protein